MCEFKLAGRVDGLYFQGGMSKSLAKSFKDIVVKIDRHGFKTFVTA